MDLREFFTIILGAGGIAWYYFCFISIGVKPLGSGQKADAFRQFMSLSVTTIGVSLSTFVGMLIGVKGSSEIIANKAIQNVKVAQLSLEWLAKSQDLTMSSKDITSMLSAFQKIDWTTTLQWVAAGLYFLSLFIAIYFWRKTREQTDPVIINLGKSLLGLFGGALAIILNLPS